MEVIIQAINKAMTKGVFNLEEASVILRSIEEVVVKLKETEGQDEVQAEPLAKV